MNQKLFISRIVIFSVINVIGVENVDPNIKGFDDSILFKINWPGKEGITNEIFDVPEFQQMTVTTENDEKYRCLIPQLTEKEKNFSEKYSGPNPLDLLAPLFKQSSCSHKLEAYWTYELCHGRYIRQYHEEREGKMVKLQEYYLGRWDKTQQEKLRRQLEEEKSMAVEHIPIKKIDGLNMPYLQLNMSDGTLCDLSSKPRLTKVLYICYIHGKHEIYSLKETSICEYEVIVLSPFLCEHPRYRPQESGEHVINCQPLGNSPKKPKSLLQMEAESLKLRHQKANDDKMQSVFAVFSVDKVAGERRQHLYKSELVCEFNNLSVLSRKPSKQQMLKLLEFFKDVSQLRVEIHPIDPDEDLDNQTPIVLPQPGDPISSVDLSLNNFLSGSDCIQGDSGWWKYEFCYGKSVIQYHVEKDGSKTVINLGNFVKAAHLDWLQANPHKMPEPSAVRRHVSHFYSGGTICGKTGKPRHTEVKLKCMDANNSHGSVSLYLLEPKVCQYILVVESKIICQLLTKIDENGLYEPNEEIGFSKAAYKNGYQPYNKDAGVQGEGENIQKEQEKVERKEKSNKLHSAGNEEVALDNHIPDGDD